MEPDNKGKKPGRGGEKQNGVKMATPKPKPKPKDKGSLKPSAAAFIPGQPKPKSALIDPSAGSFVPKGGGQSGGGGQQVKPNKQSGKKGGGKGGGGSPPPIPRRVTKSDLDASLTFVSFLPCESHDSRLPESNTFEVAEVNRLLAEALQRLLCLNPRGFAAHVLHDPSLATSLDTYLRYVRRRHDAAQLEIDPVTIVDGATEELEKIVSRRVLMALLRLGELGEAEGLVEADVQGSHSRVFHVPMLMDVCAIYGANNGSVVERIVEAALGDPRGKVWAELEQSVGPVCNVLNQLRQLTFDGASSGDSEAWGLAQVAETTSYLNDIACTLALFFRAEPDTAWAFFREPDVLPLLAALHDQVLPLLENSSEDSAAASKGADYDIISMALVDVCYGMIHHCILRPILTGVSEEEQAVMGMTMESVYERLYSLPATLAALHQGLVYPGQESGQFQGEILRGMNAIHGLREKLVGLQGQGGLDSARLESALFACADAVGEDGDHPERKYPPFEPVTLLAKEGGTSAAAGAAPARDPARMAQIRQVRDVFGELGEGFVDAALEHISCEGLINALLEGNLPPSIDKLDREMPLAPLKPAAPPPQPRVGAGKKPVPKGKKGGLHSLAVSADDALFTASKAHLQGKLWQGKRAGSGELRGLSEAERASVLVEWCHLIPY